MSFEGSTVKVDLKGLLRLYREHKIYSETQGFSPSKLEVIWTMEALPFDRVDVDEISEEAGIAKPTVYENIRELQELDFVTKDGSNQYRYTGP
jgi:Mn-dependent DtxR family transcriptional regulator